MTEDLLRAIYDTLQFRWGDKLPSIRSKAHNYASNVSTPGKAEPSSTEFAKAIRDAYTAGFREGYWEGVSDLVECGIASEQANTVNFLYDVH